MPFLRFAMSTVMPQKLKSPETVKFRGFSMVDATGLERVRTFSIDDYRRNYGHRQTLILRNTAVIAFGSPSAMSSCHVMPCHPFFCTKKRPPPQG